MMAMMHDNEICIPCCKRHLISTPKSSNHIFDVIIEENNLVNTMIATSSMANRFRHNAYFVCQVYPPIPLMRMPSLGPSRGWIVWVCCAIYGVV